MSEVHARCSRCGRPMSKTTRVLGRWHRSREHVRRVTEYRECERYGYVRPSSGSLSLYWPQYSPDANHDRVAVRKWWELQIPDESASVRDLSQRLAKIETNRLLLTSTLDAPHKSPENRDGPWLLWTAASLGTVVLGCGILIGLFLR